MKPLQGAPRGTLALGVDPSGGSSPWGIAVLEARRGYWVLSSHASPSPPRALEELLGLLRASHATPLACVDAPITLPRGGRAFRAHERAAMRLGARLIPLNTQGMAKLVRAGVALTALLLEAGIPVCETHPGSFRGRSPELVSMLAQGGLNRHEIDAVLAAAACASLIEGRSLLLKSREGCMLLPMALPKIKIL
ncbi:MAG: hypothetical protein GSR80_000099 [Desulfurococcales archaeon]|nr:hypothetical protein [Desulfurococcales archaeon]